MLLEQTLDKLNAMKLFALAKSLRSASSDRITRV